MLKAKLHKTHDEDPRFPCACSREHQEGALRRLNGTLLRLIQRLEGVLELWGRQALFTLL